MSITGFNRKRRALKRREEEKRNVEMLEMRKMAGTFSNMVAESPEEGPEKVVKPERTKKAGSTSVRRTRTSSKK